MTEAKLDMSKHTVRTCIILIRERWFIKSQVQKDAELALKLLQKSSLNEHNQEMDTEDELELSEIESVESQTELETCLKNIRKFYKPITCIVAITGSTTFQSIAAAATVKLAMVPMFLSPVNYKRWENYNKSERPDIFIRRSCHYMKYYHSDQTQKLENISEDKAVNVDLL